MKTKKIYVYAVDNEYNRFAGFIKAINISAAQRYVDKKFPGYNVLGAVSDTKNILAKHRFCIKCGHHYRWHNKFGPCVNTTCRCTKFIGEAK